MVFMFKVYNNQCHRHLLCFFERLYDSHNHNTSNKVNNFKITYSRTSQKASCISVIISYGIIYTKICNVANRFLSLKPTIKECYSKDTNTWINYHSTLSFIDYKLINTSILTYAMLVHFSDMQANRQIDIYNIYIYTVYSGGSYVSDCLAVFLGFSPALTVMFLIIMLCFFFLCIGQNKS